jgi:hypothetical protein
LREGDRLGIAGYLDGFPGCIDDDATVLAVVEVMHEALDRRWIELAVEIFGKLAENLLASQVRNLLSRTGGQEPAPGILFG